jgi:hypothetical protein
MGIGLGITLLVLGAIMYFTPLDSNLLNTNLNVVGIILMVGGVLALIMGVIQNGQRARTQHTTVTERRGGPDVVERDVVARDVVDRDVADRETVRRETRDRDVVDRRDDGL